MATETVAELEAELALVNTAISDILKTGKSYNRAGFSLTRVDLKDLREHRNSLRSTIARLGSTGSSFVSDYSGVTSSLDGWTE